MSLGYLAVLNSKIAFEMSTNVFGGFAFLTISQNQFATCNEVVRCLCSSSMFVALQRKVSAWGFLHAPIWENYMANSLRGISARSNLGKLHGQLATLLFCTPSTSLTVLVILTHLLKVGNSAPFAILRLPVTASWYHNGSYYEYFYDC